MGIEWRGGLVDFSLHETLQMCTMLFSTQKRRDCDTVTFFPKNVPFPEIKLEYFLRQAAEDIVTILTLLPSTTAPSLEAGDPFQNALLTLATQLKRVQQNPYQEIIPETVSSPRL